MENTKKLEREFIGTGEVKGSRFLQIAETGSAYLYQVEVDVDLLHYEVFEKKLTPVCLDFENHVYSETEFKEMYPKAKDFGNWAWTYKEYNSAIGKMNSI